MVHSAYAELLPRAAAPASAAAASGVGGRQGWAALAAAQQQVLQQVRKHHPWDPRRGALAMERKRERAADCTPAFLRIHTHTHAHTRYGARTLTQTQTQKRKAGERKEDGKEQLLGQCGWQSDARCSV